MAKIVKSFVCEGCGTTSPKWLGKCPSCGEWNSFIEKIDSKETVATKITMKNNSLPNKEIVTITENSITNIGSRILCGIEEWDNLLGGGVMEGSAILIGGEPGIGKSTILLQVSKGYADNNKKVLYITGEESENQVIHRAKRLNTLDERISLYTETCFEDILPKIDNKQFDIVIIDSIQTMYSLDIESIPGTITQMREITYRLFNLAKKSGISIFIVGHITKNGSIAGPKVVEHIVDGVYYFEGDKQFNLRVVRSTKNRFGSTEEIALFEMKEQGLVPFDNSKSLFLEDGKNDGAGSSIGCIKEGSRYMLVEIQSLAVDSNYGVAQRISVGIEQKKNSIILAILEKHLHIELGRVDVFFNVSGGFKIKDSFVDLAIASSFLLSFMEISPKMPILFVGEVSLSGSIRNPSDIERRVAEANKLGIKKVVSPTIDKKIKDKFNKENIEFITIDNISNLANTLNNL